MPPTAPAPTPTPTTPGAAAAAAAVVAAAYNCHDDDSDHDRLLAAFSCHQGRSPLKLFLTTADTTASVRWLGRRV